jgi:hypothetical protein
MPHFGDNPPDSADRRFQSFMTWYGEIPEQAVRVEELKARERAASWAPERFRNDSASNCDVSAYELGARWWILLFERSLNGAPSNAENWSVEVYGHDGSSCASNYFYWPAENRWRHFLHELRGANYGRYRP